MKTIVPCELCRTPTSSADTRRCDRCWELERRIQRDPAIARTILDALAPPSPDGGQVFPVPDCSQNLATGETVSHQSVGGMTLRDYFAARAPAEIPAWFQHPDQFEVPAQLPMHEALALVPDWHSLGTHERETLASWVADGCFDLEEKLEPIGQAARALLEVNRKTIESTRANNEAARFFAWRWHYATNMVRTR